MDHIRIDEGVKRTKSIPPRERQTESGSHPAIPADLDPKEVLDLYLQYPTTSGIAEKLGVRRSTLTLWLRSTVPEDWRNVQIARALMRKEDADEEIEGAADALSLARAREMLRSGQWDLERLDSRNYGQQTHVSVELVGDLGDRLRRATERVIENDAPQLPQRTTTHNEVEDAQVIDSNAE